MTRTMLDFINPLYGWTGVTLAIVAGAAAVAYFFPPFRRYAGAAAIAAVGALTLYRKGYKAGESRTKREWDDAEKKSIDRGKQANADAKRDVRSGRVRDKFDRDDI
jgi:membrane protein DedA with SNARE-associated domain